MRRQTVRQTVRQTERQNQRQTVKRKRIARRHKLVPAAIGSIWMAAAGIFPAAAAPIQTVKIHLTAETFDEEGRPVLEAVCSSGKYEVIDFVEIKAEEAEETDEQTLEAGHGGTLYEVELISHTEDGFAVMEQKDIRLTGVGGVCMKAVRKDGGQTLRLSVRPGSTGEITGEIAHVSLGRGRASWTSAPNASAYLFMLFKDSKRLGVSYRTQGLEYDFSPLIRDAGIYHCKVYPLTESGRKGRGAESGRERLDREEAEQIREEFERRRAGCFSGEGTPGWHQTEDDWYYIQKDGTYPQENGLMIDGEWYFFDRDGRVAR